MIRLGLALLLGLAAVYAFGAQWGWDAVLPVLPDPPATERTRDLALAPEAQGDETTAPVEAASPAPPVREYAVTPAEWREDATAASEPGASPGDAAEIEEPVVAASEEGPIPQAAASTDVPAAEPDPLASLAAPPVPEPADLDRSADLVRRMLSLHRRAGARR